MAPVQCSVWLSGIADGPQFPTFEVAQPDIDSVWSGTLDDVIVVAQPIDYNATIADRGRTLVHLPAVVVLRRVQQFDDLDLRILGERVHAG